MKEVRLMVLASSIVSIVADHFGLTHEWKPIVIIVGDDYFGSIFGALRFLVGFVDNPEDNFIYRMMATWQWEVISAIPVTAR